MKRRFELMAWPPVLQLLFLMGLVFLSILAFQLLFSIVLLSFSSYEITGVTDLSDLSPGWSRWMVVFNQLGMFLFPAMVFAYFYQKELSLQLFFSTNKRASGKLIFFFILFIPCSIFSVDLFEFLNRELIELLPGTIQESLAQSRNASNANISHVLIGNSIPEITMQMLAVALLPAVAEEIFFRGVLTRVFYQFTLNIHIAILTVALFFAALHLQFHYLLPMWFMGIILGYVYYWTGSIVYSILLHFINNSIAILGTHFFQDISEGTKDLFMLGFSILLPLFIYLMTKNKNEHSLNTWYKY